MIRIQIKGESTYVPKFNELTVKRYREVAMYVTEESKLSILRYISITTGIDYKQLMSSKIKGIDSFTKRVGEFIYCDPCPSDAVKGTFGHFKGTKIIKYEGKWYDFNKMKMREAGYRVMYEQYIKSAKNIMDVYTFFVAMAIDSDFDYENTLEIQKNLEKLNAYKVFYLGAFFFERWKRGAIKGYNFSRLLTRLMSINIKMKKPALELTN